MLRNIGEITGYRLQALDGEIGRCKDFLFDDRDGAIRYMVAKTARWLPGRKVVMSPSSLDQPDWVGKRLPLNLTRKQIEDSPPLDEHAPVSRQFEIQFHEYYALPFYWVGPIPWGHHPGESGAVEPVPEASGSEDEDEDSPEEEGHLRSADEVTGYTIEASDGEIGHVEDFMVDDETWEIEYLVVDTRNWLPGRKVLVPINRLDTVRWVDRSVHLDMTREAIENSPEFDPSAPPGRRAADLLLYHEAPELRGEGTAESAQQSADETRHGKE